jgi:hypothetical protein
MENTSSITWTCSGTDEKKCGKHFIYQEGKFVETDKKEKFCVRCAGFITKQNK